MYNFFFTARNGQRDQSRSRWLGGGYKGQGWGGGSFFRSQRGKESVSRGLSGPGLFTKSDAADEEESVKLVGTRICTKTTNKLTRNIPESSDNQNNTVSPISASRT